MTEINTPKSIIQISPSHLTKSKNLHLDSIQSPKIQGYRSNNGLHESNTAPLESIHTNYYGSNEANVQINSYGHGHHHNMQPRSQTYGGGEGIDVLHSSPSAYRDIEQRSVNERDLLLGQDQAQQASTNVNYEIRPELTAKSSTKTKNIHVCTKISTNDLKISGNAFIERDFSKGHSRNVVFDLSKHPDRLLERIENDLLIKSITEINYILSYLNTTSFFYFLESIFLLFTGFIFASSFTFFKKSPIKFTKYDRQVERLNEIIDGQNKDIYLPRGLQLLSPMRSGFRNLQIVIYDIEEYLPVLEKPIGQHVEETNFENQGQNLNQGGSKYRYIDSTAV